MEEEIRKHLGEGFGRRGWLVVQDQRRQMYNLARKLEDEDVLMKTKAQELEELLQVQQAAQREKRPTWTRSSRPIVVFWRRP